MPTRQVNGSPPLTGVVLSGGGARGAYEVGVVAGMVDVLQDARLLDRPPFQIFCGTSVGAINAAFLASRADVADMGVGQLIDRWAALSLDQHLRLDTRGIFEFPRALFRRSVVSPSAAPSLLDPTALATLIDESIDWVRLHENVAGSRVLAVILAALEISTGRTTLFAELAPDARYVPSRDPRRETRATELASVHVLASAALPFLFPPREVEGEFYCDGGVRFNTPIAPAIRAGADRLVVVSPLFEDLPAPTSVEAARVAGSYANPIFLIGKLLNALLLDPTRYDLHILARNNSIVETLERVLSPGQMEEFHRVVERERDMRYRKLRTLVFRPTQDIGELAHEHKPKLAQVSMPARFLVKASSSSSIWHSDFLSFLLFDGEFVKTLIDLGRREAHQRAAEIAAFFGS